MADLRTLLAGLLLLVVAGCAVVPRGPLPADTAVDDACLALFTRVEAETRSAGVEDGGAARISEFPWLRIDRFLASLSGEATNSEAAFDAWLARLGELERTARRFEIDNLPRDARNRLREDWRAAAYHHALPAGPLEALQACQPILDSTLRQDPAARQALLDAARVEDDYVAWQRVLGLYPLSSRLARSGVVRLHRRLADGFDREADVRIHYAAVPAAASRAARLPGIDGPFPRDALGVPSLPREALDAVFDIHAPIWSIETHAAADRPGALVLDGDDRPEVDIGEPVEYRWSSFTRLGEELLLQLNYAVWFPERPAQHRFDIVAGHLDGVIWRVTLDGQGAVLAFDSIHLCGCYYLVFPAAGWRAVEAAWHEEPVLAPQGAPRPEPGERVMLTLESGTHYLIGVVGANLPSELVELEVHPMDTLRSLPLPAGGRASLYRPDGLIPASRRPERFVLWPLGVRSAGAMRQPGRHAIAFVGRRHFDDPRLLEQVLEPEPGP